MSSEPGNESFFCALRPIPRILSLRRRDYASQVQIGEPSRRKTISGGSRAPDANRYGARCRCRQRATSEWSAGVRGDPTEQRYVAPHFPQRGFWPGITAGYPATRAESDELGGQCDILTS